MAQDNPRKRLEGLEELDAARKQSEILSQVTDWPDTWARIDWLRNGDDRCFR